MRVLILGSRGVIGRSLVEHLLASGHLVKEWDILLSRDHDLSNASTLSALSSAIDKSDFIFFLAYDVGGSKYITNPTLEFMNNNSRIMLNTFPLLAKKPFIFASSTMSNMNIAYGALKMVGEHYTRILGGIVARFWNVYGPQETGFKAHAITDFIESFVTTGTVQLRTDGNEKRQFLHSKDCASCLETMMMNYKYMLPVVDVSSFEWTTIWETAALVNEKVLKGTCQGDSHSFLNEPNEFILKFWKPSITLKDGIEGLLREKLSEMSQGIPLSTTNKQIPESVASHDMKRIKFRAPTRIDLAGGWTDIPDVATRSGGEVVAFAINYYIYTEAFENSQGFKYTYESTAPMGSGLGTSGAMNVSLIAAIDGLKSKKEDIAERAFLFETLAGNIGGRQDQYMAALGGFRRLTFENNVVTHKLLYVSDELGRWFRDRLLLFDSEMKHASRKIHEDVWANFRAENPAVLRGLDLQKQAAEKMATAINAQDTKGIAMALLASNKSLDLIDARIHEPFKAVMRPLERGGEVLAWKATGAGAGGCVIVLVAEGSKQTVHTACKQAGWKLLYWDFDDDGLCQI